MIVKSNGLLVLDNSYIWIPRLVRVRNNLENFWWRCTGNQLYNYNKNNPNGVCNSQRREPIDDATFKRKCLQKITLVASFDFCTPDVYSVEELFNRAKKWMVGFTVAQDLWLYKMCVSAQKLLDFYNEIRAWAQ